MPVSNEMNPHPSKLSEPDKVSPRSDALSSEFHVFSLTPNPTNRLPPDFSLSGESTDKLCDASSETTRQGSLFLPQENPESPISSPQISLQGMQPEHYCVDVHHPNTSRSPAVFQYAQSLMASLESQGITLPFQCREGYCGSCRSTLIDGTVTYQKTPMAWLNDNEILPCCCIPTSDITIKLNN